MRYLKFSSIMSLAFLACMPLAYAEEETATLDPAANTFVIICAILVMLMSVPAIGLFYGGLVRAKSVLSVLEQCLVVFSLAFVLWMLVGYSIGFTDTDGFLSQFFGSCSKLGLLGITTDSLHGNLSEFTFVTFQGAFCAISACLIVGATVERIRFGAILFAIGVWIVFSYAPLAHMVWGGGFIDSNFKAYDFAGGVVVHINAAVAGLVGAKVLGPRHDLGKVVLAPHNLPITYIGAGLLWIGWFGFNAGSELTADGTAAIALLNTAIAPAAAALSWMAAEWVLFKKPSTLGTSSGVVGGLVAITPACAFVGPFGALIIGLVAGFLCLWGVHGFKRLTKVDDSLDVFGIHGIGGIVGALLTGIFCAPGLGGAGYNGDYTSVAGQFYGQFMSVVIGVVWSGVVAYISFKLAAMLFGGLRVESEEETEGLDLASHGERGYNLP